MKSMATDTPTQNPPEQAQENAGQQPTRINLGEVVNKYLDGLQRVYDVINYTLAAERLLNEQEYDEYSRSSRVMPSQKSRLSYDEAKEEMQTWLLKQTLNESLGLLTLFLDDCRTISGISKWKADENRKEEEIQKLLNEERGEFLRLDLVKKIDFLQDKYALKSESTDHIKSLYRARLALANNKGVVTENETGGADEKLSVKMRSVRLSSSPSSGQEGVLVKSEVGDIDREFGVGEKIRFSKNEHISSILTVAFFITSQAQSLKEYATKLGVIKN